MRLDAICTDTVEKWFDKMIGKGYAHNSINNYFKILRTMIGWAVKKQIIGKDPIASVQKLLPETKDKRLGSRPVPLYSIFSFRCKKLCKDLFNM